ncbi:MAG TPA: hypothetical protein VNV37_10610 [Solirubrobacteraceae bacterium]|nr:hypothetical protein [Solirubrobacteraceae bacterium]
MARSFAAGSSTRPASSGWTPPLGRVARVLTPPLSVVLPRLATPKRLAVALATVALLTGGWLWLRDSPLVAVERARITGVQGVDAPQIDAALRSAARRMSTLNVSIAALRAAVAPYRVVRSLSVATEFPHGLRIDVVEQPPVAEVSATGVHTAVAADGVVLGPALLTASSAPLPSIALAGLPAPPGGRIGDPTARGELSVLGAAPRVLLGWVAKVFTGGEGLTVQMRNGVSIYFGDATRAHAKWLAAARVLADPSSAGATYVDVRDPERPAAGITAGGGLEGTAGAGGVSASDPNSAVIANALAEAVSGGATATAGVASAPVEAGSQASGASRAGGAVSAPAGASPGEPGSTAATAAPATAPTTTATPSAPQTTATPSENPEASLSTSG